MIRVVIMDQNGKTILPRDVATAAELREAAKQARELIEHCEQIARLKAAPRSGTKTGSIPYMT